MTGPGGQAVCGRGGSGVSPPPRSSVVTGGTLVYGVGMWGSRSAPARQRPSEEHDIRGPLGEAAHEIAVPLAAVRHVDAHRVPDLDQPALLVRSDAVEHLEFKCVGRAVEPFRPVLGDGDETRI